MKYICDICGYEYDEAVGEPENDIPAGTKWADLDENYVCPVCGAPKEQFSPADAS
ncbi:MAG: rubredoxin [Eubacteriales bacterium]